MARNRPHRIDVDENPADMDPDGLVGSMADRGRAVLDRVPALARDARTAMADAQARLDELSDVGVTGATGFALGVTSSLIVAGMPRVVVMLSMVPAALALRSAMGRGVRPAGLVN